VTILARAPRERSLAVSELPETQSGGRALLHMDDPESARTALHGALELARAIGYPPVQWRAL